MSDKGTASPRGAWSATAIAATVAVLVASAVVGFVWLPPQHPSATVAGLWNAICSAAGVVRPPPSKEAIVTPTYPTTRVVVTPQMLAGADARAIGSGATLALRCTMCHGANGQSQAETPNLAGQYRAAIYKQLVDFQTGVRSNAIMQPLVAGLSDTDMRDLADYYAYLPRAPDGGGGAGMAAPTIVASGAPMRGIAPCGACHGTIGEKAGAPWLGGQPVAYLRAQLTAFASGARRNDIDEQMRNIARQMTPAEIEAASQYYAQYP